MNKRYYLAMLSVYPLMLLFDVVYFGIHQSWEVLLITALVHLLLFGGLNWVGSYFIFRPIQQAFNTENPKVLPQQRVRNLIKYSSCWVFAVGFLYVLMTFFTLMFLNPNVERFSEGKIPLHLLLTFMPSILFVHAIFPSFITYFLINDYTQSLKAEIYRQFQILFPTENKRIRKMLIIVFVVLVFFPTLLVILELFVVTNMGADYAEFTKVNPIETVLIDRIVVLVGAVFAVVLITRAFTRPMDSLLQEISKVKDGDFSTQAAIVSDDEIGILTKEFNEMVTGLSEREFIRSTFGKFVNEEIAQKILSQDSVELEGEERTGTILVTDIENYTTLSEEIPAKEIVQMLNEYFSSVVQVIQDHHGVVNKFIGDAIFAMFNVPFDDPDHAKHAIDAALAIQAITTTQTFGKHHRKLNTRVGINTGVFVAGNLGSKDRMEYTVIGDDVNVAARLEQLNKTYGTRILVGENTFELAKDSFSFSQMGRVQLKGKEKELQVYRIDSPL